MFVTCSLSLFDSSTLRLFHSFGDVFVAFVANQPRPTSRGTFARTSSRTSSRGYEQRSVTPAVRCMAYYGGDAAVHNSIRVPMLECLRDGCVREDILKCFCVVDFKRAGHNDNNDDLLSHTSHRVAL